MNVLQKLDTTCGEQVYLVVGVRASICGGKREAAAGSGEQRVTWGSLGGRLGVARQFGGAM